MEWNEIIYGIDWIVVDELWIRKQLINYVSMSVFEWWVAWEHKAAHLDLDGSYVYPYNKWMRIYIYTRSRVYALYVVQ